MDIENVTKHIPPSKVVRPDEMLRMLSDQLGMGFWRFEIKTGAVFWSERAFEIYGLPLQEGPLDLDTVMSVIVPGDRKRSIEMMKETLAEMRGRKYVFRVNTAAGIKVIEATTDCTLGPSGDVVEIFGSILDVTSRVAPDGSAVSRSLLLRALMKNIPAAIAVFDLHMNYLAVSDFWVSGHNAKNSRELIGKNHYVLRPDIKDEHKAEHRRVLAGETMRSQRSYTRDRFGNPIHQLSVMCPWHTVEGTIGGMILMLGTVDLDTAPTGAAVTRELPTKRELLEVLRTVA